ncbi:MAG: protoporphyrinogen oxidase [Puniceicoccales bacterium]|jgi:oxygen-dependent protoporphyrinogen oxidase|nr:protoporphyrinogen oxidase [Puniceicoccales bacterium]
MNPDVIIIGAGPAGLATATALLRGGLEPLVLESAERAGGAVTSHRENGFLVECGPSSLMLEKADGTEAFFSDIGLFPQEAATAAAKRFLVCGGRPVAAPSGPIGAVTTPLLSFRGKLRILAEPFSRAAPEEEETVAAFARRRLGAEVVTRLIDPMVAGVYAGDAERLSLRHAFPRLLEMEQRYGSLVAAGLRKGRAAPRRRLVNFAGGMADIPAAMARALGGERLQTGAVLREITPTPDGWSVVWTCAGETRRATARFLLPAIPPWHWSELPLPDALKRHLLPWQDVVAPPVSVISLGFKREQVAHPLDGFGMLVPAVEKRKILGTLFPSTLFPDRAPEGHVLLTTFLGGCRQPELARADAAVQIGIVREELREMLGAQGEPVFTHFRHWPRAIPQYNLGYGKLLALLDDAEEEYAGLRFCGSYRKGPALAKTIQHAIATARKILVETGRAKP